MKVRRAHIIGLAVLMAVAGFALGILTVTPGPGMAPDWTVAPCSWWAHDATPDLPPYTVPDTCAFQAPDGTWQLSTPEQLPTR